MNDEFPKEFTVQRIEVAAVKAVSYLPPAYIARYFQKHPRRAEELLIESANKRFMPSSFITEEPDGFRVGWFSSHFEYKCVKQFHNLADAATDYVLFSLGKGRWTPPESDSI